jgi:hypothetical protein
MPSTGRQHPTLAAVAARAASAGSAAVQFAVTHVGPGTDLAPSPDAASGPPEIPRDTLVFRLAGVGFTVHTWASRTPNRPIDGASTSRVVVSQRAEDTGFARQQFTGSAVINPDFLYDAAHSTEILLTLGRRQPWQPDYADSLMLALVYRTMATAAADNGVPLLFLQSPVAPYRDPPGQFRGDGSGEEPRIPNGMALRMLVGLDVGHPGRRLDLVRHLAAVAIEHGLGMQVADRRFGRVRGEWWTVLRPDDDRYVARKKARFGWAPPGTPKAVRLLTFVGPSRVGSSAAIAAHLTARNVGILAVSEASMQEVAFINLVVPIAPARLGRAPGGTCLPIGDGLGSVASGCGLTRRRDTQAVSSIAGSPATDYYVLSTSPVRARITDANTPSDRPLWLSWGIPVDEDDPDLRPPDVAQLVLAKLLEEELVTAAQLDYYRVRIAPDGRLRGRAKITVSLVDGVTRPEVPRALSTLCPHAQREAAADLVRRGLPVNAIRLRLAWRERWLGRSGTLP